MLILKHDVERDVLREVMGRNWVRDINFEVKDGADLCGGIAKLNTISTYMPCRNERLDPFARKRRDAFGQRAIESPARMFRAQLDRKSGKTRVHRYALT